ncbi:MAG: MFS transporter [Opitutaceae bacterium]|nr:MFS transporter [Opitutaceae bacterium]
MKSRRWIILALLFCASVINFIDRQSLSILARTIQDELGISDLGYSTVVQMFLFAYMLSFLGAGWVTDRLGIRLSMTLFIAWWSLSNMLTGLAGSLRSLAGARFLLGAGESGLYTVAPKVVGELFSPAQRGLAVGVYTAGATIGATVAPPLIAFLALNYGWRPAFFITGALGLFWIIPWLIFYRPAGKGVAEPVAAPAAIGAGREWRWRDVLFCREALLLLAARTLTDPVWHFVLFWFPKYLTDVQKMSLPELGRIAWIVYLAADVGCLAGGFLSGRLVQRGLRPVEARKWTMTAAAVLIPCSALVPLFEAKFAIMTLVSIIALAHMTWIVTLTTLAVDLFPASRLGSIFGVIAAGSGLGGMLFTNLVGRLVTHFSYSPVFVIMGCMHPIALILIWRAVASARWNGNDPAGAGVATVEEKTA